MTLVLRNGAFSAYHCDCSSDSALEKFILAIQLIIKCELEVLQVLDLLSSLELTVKGDSDLHEGASIDQVRETVMNWVLNGEGRATRRTAWHTFSMAFEIHILSTHRC